MKKSAPAPADAPVAAPPAAAAAPAPAPAATPAPSPAAALAAAPAQPAPSHHHAPSRPPTADFESGLHFAHGLAFEHRGHAPTRAAAPRHPAPGHGSRTARASGHTSEHRTMAPREPLTGPHTAGSPAALPLAGAAPHGAPAQHLTAAKHDAGGLDVGWLAALLGLLAAALCLGRPDASARAARAGRDRIGALLHARRAGT